MRFGVLGPLAVWKADGTTVRIPELKVRALLADLLVHEGRPVSVDRLAEDLWRGKPPGNPVNTLQTKVSQLRRALEEAEPGGRHLVVHQPPGYLLLLRAGHDEIDAQRFQDLVTLADETEDPAARAALLLDALGLWRGPALADLGDEAFAQAMVARLEEQRLTTLEHHAEARLELGQHGRLADELGELVARNPLRERLRAAQMLALYRAGRQSEALATYGDLRDRLVMELGLDPSPELTALHVAILKQDPALAPPPIPAPSTKRLRTNLPAPLTDLVGRAEAVTEACRMLDSGRLVTLTGPGGVGKTRLAVETAAQLVGRFPDGVWLVELAGLRPGNQDVTGSPAEAVMTVLGIREDATSGPPGDGPMGLIDRLAGALRSERLLLVLDSCEHVVERVAELTAALLRTAPELHILATSREPLGLSGEVVLAVPPLEQTSAVQLFVARAAAAAPGFTLGPGDADAVAVLCRRLDGIPLALELAASRVRALSVHELVARLDDPLRLLAAGHRGGPPRQRTLRATIDWSWNLLTDSERMVLRRLAVHVDGFALQAAESICSGEGIAAEDVLGLLVRLVDRSLVVVASEEGGSRYRLLESVADYCLERLDQAGEGDRARQRHQGYYTELAEWASPHLYGGTQRQWLERLDRETSNLRRALEGAVRDRQPDRALRLVNAMVWYWFLRGRFGEARRSMDMARAVARGTDPAAARARALAWRTGIAALAGDADRQALHRAAAVEMLQSIDDAGARARAEWFLGFVECDLGDLSVSEELVERALRTARAVADRWCIAAALSTRAKQAMLRGDLGEVERSGTQSLEMFGALGDRWGQLQSTEWLGALARIRGDYERATALHRDGWRMAEELGLWPQAADQLSWLGRVAMHLGDYAQARDLHERALRLAARHSYKPGETFAELGLGLLARREGRLDAADAHLRSVLERSRPVGVIPGVAVTLSLVELGFIAEQRGDAAAAETLHLDGFAASQKLGDPRAMALALEGLAGARALAAHHGQAARLLGMADAARKSAGAPLPPAEQGDVDRITAIVRPALGEEAFTSEFAFGANLDPHDALDWIGPLPRGPQRRRGTRRSSHPRP